MLVMLSRESIHVHLLSMTANMDSPGRVCNFIEAKHSDYICKSMRRFLFWLVQFPYYPYAELVKKISKLGHEVGVDEIKEYEEVSSKVTRRPILIMISASFLFSLKILYHPWLLARTIDFKDLDLNSTNQWVIDNNTIQSFCIQSNCTRFFSIGTEYSLDIRHFPIIPTCHPTLGQIYAPTIFLGPYAMLLHCALGSTVLAYGVIIPLINLYYPAKCDTLMFLVAPELTMRMMSLCAIKIHEEYKTSYLNYIRKNKYISSNFQYRLTYLVPPAKRTSRLERFPVMNSCFLAKDHEKTSGDPQRISSDTHFGSSKYSSSLQYRYAQDCLPNIRTMSWHSKIQRKFVKWLAFSVACISFQGLVVAVDLAGRFMIKSNEFDFMRHEMYQSGCRGWYLSPSGEKDIIPPYPTWTLKWNIATLLDSIILINVYNLAVCFVSLYLMINHELSIWLSEIHNELEILIEVTRYRSYQESHHKLFEAERRRRSSFKDSERLQMDVTSIRNWFQLHKDQFDRRKLISKICTQQLVSRKLSDAELTSDGYFDQMVKHYISLRLLTNYINDCSSTISVLSSGNYLACFLIELFAVWHGRLVGQFGSEHIITTTSCVLWTVMFLAIMSNFHAKVSTHN